MEEAEDTVNEVSTFKKPLERLFLPLLHSCNAGATLGKDSLSSVLLHYGGT